MKNLIIILVLVALGVGAYQFLGSGSASKMERLDYVPADTVVLSAQVEPLDMKTYLASLGLQPGQYGDLSTMLEQELEYETDESAKFAMSLFASFIDAVSTPDQMEAKTGIKNQLRSLLFMNGVAPVIHFELQDEAKFLAFFAEAQQASNIAFSDELLDGQSYVRYVLDENEQIDLLVRAADGWGVVALHSPKLGEEHLKTTMAFAKQQNPLVGSEIYKKLTKDYGMGSQGFGFISTEQIGLMFTSLDGNSLAKDLNLLAGDELAQEFEMFREPACKADIGMLTALWPGLFIDSKVNMKGDAGVEVQGSMLIPTNSQVAIDGLKALRGFIPGYVKNNNSIMSIGVGLEVAELSGSVNSMFNAMANLPLSCEPLVMAQEELKQNNPTGAFAMAGVANGFFGTAAAINEFVFDMSGESMAIDAVVSVSAKNISALYGSLQTFVPFLGAQPLPAAGEELSLNQLVPMLDQFGIQVMAQANQEHLVIYAGEKAKAQAESVLSESVEANGLQAITIDYGQFFKQLLPIMQMSGQPMPPELESMMETDMVLSVDVNVNDKGIVMDSTVLVK
ncbi:hypothetical protein ISG33_16325 [Glaciecola sp. MH2013]|uniref:hypothetical protein n=1 Tax=Glaciecola sp. MH2013 TaxID=2785524 RepID=UPI00189D2736|nr:hypothetical protein [Glaciecola sp. MH2013]MBF7074968.1 hypothetical protein [Glaciecola sp. MH2013]